MLALKRNGELRFTLDYRKLSTKVPYEQEEQQLAEVLLARLPVSCLFTVADCFKGFHQIPLHKDCQEYTAFTIGKTYCWQTLPMGMSVSPSAFIRAMKQVLADVPHCFSYVDDILLCHSKYETAVAHFVHFLKILRKFNFMISLQKLQLFKRSVRYLGHVLTPKGILPDPNKKYASSRNFRCPKIRQNSVLSWASVVF